MEVLAKRLKWLRKKERFSQKEVATKIGMTVSGYQKIEYNEREPKLDVLIKLAQLYNVSTDFLLGLSHYYGDLEKIVENITETKIKLMEIRQTLKYGLLDERIIEDEVELLKLKQNSEKEKEFLKFRMEKLRELKRSNKVLENELNKLKAKYSTKMMEYIFAILEIPESRPWEDKVIKEVLPIEAQIQLTIFDTYVLFLIGKNDFVGEYGEFKDVEIAKQEEVKILKLLNGKDYMIRKR